MELRKFDVAIVDGARRTLWRPVLKTWPQLVELFTKHEIRTDKDGPGFAPCAVEPGSHRSGTCEQPGPVKYNTLAVLDLDGEKKCTPCGTKYPCTKHTKEEAKPYSGIPAAKFAEIIGRIAASGLAFVVYSSHTHTGALCKARVVFRPDRVIYPAEWGALCSGLIRTFDLVGYADPSIATLSRFYFLPSAPPDLNASDLVALSREGADLDVTAVVLAERERIKTVVGGIDNLLAPSAEIKAAAELIRSEGPRIVDLAEMRRTLRSVAKGRKNGDLINRMLDGEPIATEGSRNNTLNVLCSVLRTVLPPNVDVDGLLELMRPSLSLFEAGIDDLTGEREDWVEIARSMLERAGERKLEYIARMKKMNDTIADSLRRESSRAGRQQRREEREVTRAEEQAKRQHEARTEGGALPIPEPEPEPEEEEPDADATAPYTDMQLATWAVEQDCETIDEFSRRWIVEHNDRFFLFVDGDYLDSVTFSGLKTTIRRDFSRSPVKLMVPDDKGGEKRRPIEDVRDQHSSLARQMNYTYLRNRSFYTPTGGGRLEIASAVTRVRPARFHADIDQWLRLLDPKGRLLDWIATIDMRERYTSAVYFDSVKGTGKTLLANGLAKLWTEGTPTSLEEIIGGFNATLLRCPLVFADEALPKKAGITAWLRAFIGRTSHPINEKHKAPTYLLGASRLILAANNNRIFNTDEELSERDIEAIGDRILYLQVDHEPVKHLRGLAQKGVDLISWEREKIAEHALWLIANRKVDTSDRFLVSGNSSEFSSNLILSNQLASQVVEWLARYFARPFETPLVQVGSGEVWINVEALTNPTTWERYMPASLPLSLDKLTRALRAISSGEATVYVTPDAPTRFARILGERVMAWIGQFGASSLEVVRARIAADNEHITRWHSWNAGAKNFTRLSQDDLMNEDLIDKTTGGLIS